MPSKNHLLKQPFFFLKSSSDIKKHFGALVKNPPPFVALDTEFMRTKTYFPEPCLLQLATKNALYAVDLLATDIDLEPLKNILSNTKTTKVLHAAEQDLEVFVQLFGIVPQPFFDTQIATMFLKPLWMPSYKEAVALFCGAELSKEHQRFDWRTRPLPPHVLQYALDDVRYLVPLYQACLADLASKGRATWMKEEMQHFQVPLQNNTPSPPWRKVKMWQNTVKTRQAFACLKHLAAWRENKAKKNNKTRMRVLHDETLLSLVAMLCDKNPFATKAIEVEKVLSKKAGVAEAKLLYHALFALSIKGDEDLEPLPKGTPLSSSEKKRCAQLKNTFLKRAESLNMHRSFLITQKEIEQMARGKTPERIKKGWRAPFAVATSGSSACLT